MKIQDIKIDHYYYVNTLSWKYPDRAFMKQRAVRVFEDVGTVQMEAGGHHHIESIADIRRECKSDDYPFIILTDDGKEERWT